MSKGTHKILIKCQIHRYDEKMMLVIPYENGKGQHNYDVKPEYYDHLYHPLRCVMTCNGVWSFDLYLSVGNNVLKRIGNYSDMVGDVEGSDDDIRFHGYHNITS